MKKTEYLNLGFKDLGFCLIYNVSAEINIVVLSNKLKKPFFCINSYYFSKISIKSVKSLCISLNLKK